MQIVSNTNNPSKWKIERAFGARSMSWEIAWKVEFSLVGGEHLKMSVTSLIGDDDDLTIEGMIESGKRVKVYYSLATGTGTAEFITSSAQPGIGA